MTDHPTGLKQTSLDAICLYAARDYQSYLAEFTKALKEPIALPILLHCVLCLQRLEPQNTATAINVFKGAVAGDPWSATFLAIAQGELEPAEALKADSENWKACAAFYYHGAFHLSAGRIAEALAGFRQALQYECTSIEFLLAHGELHGFHNSSEPRLRDCSPAKQIDNLLALASRNLLANGRASIAHLIPHIEHLLEQADVPASRRATFHQLRVLLYLPEKPSPAASAYFKAAAEQ